MKKFGAISSQGIQNEVTAIKNHVKREFPTRENSLLKNYGTGVQLNKLFYV